MKFKRFGDKYILRLDKGEEIISSLLEFVDKEKIKFGYFTGLGAVTNIELGYFYQPEKEYSGTVLEGGYEISSLIGNITRMDGKPYVHVHCVIGDNKVKCFSGHLTKAIVGPTVEIVLIAIDGGINRKFDAENGLNLLEL